MLTLYADAFGSFNIVRHVWIEELTEISRNKFNRKVIYYLFTDSINTIAFWRINLVVIIVETFPLNKRNGNNFNEGK